MKIMTLAACLGMLAACGTGESDTSTSETANQPAANSAGAAAPAVTTLSCPAGRQVAFACSLPSGGSVIACGGGMAASYKSTGGPSGALELERKAGAGLVSSTLIGNEQQSGSQSTLRFSDNDAEHIMVSSFRGSVSGGMTFKNKVVMMREGNIVAQEDCSPTGLTELNLSVFETQLPQGRETGYDDHWF